MRIYSKKERFQHKKFEESRFDEIGSLLIEIDIDSDMIWNRKTLLIDGKHYRVEILDKKNDVLFVKEIEMGKPSKERTKTEKPICPFCSCELDVYHENKNECIVTTCYNCNAKVAVLVKTNYDSIVVEKPRILKLR
jgi:hypothetical protein